MISTKIENANNHQSMVDGEYSNLQRKLEDFTKSSESVINSIERQFDSLRQVLNQKETEIKLFLEDVFSQRRDILTNEIQNLEKMNFKTESLIDIVEFALTYPTTFFPEGKRKIFFRYNII